MLQQDGNGVGWYGMGRCGIAWCYTVQPAKVGQPMVVALAMTIAMVKVRVISGNDFGHGNGNGIGDGNGNVQW